MCVNVLVMETGTICQLNGIAMFLCCIIFVYLCRTAHRRDWHSVVVEWSTGEYADTVGVALDCHRRLSVISVCGSNLSHKLGGKSLGTPAGTLRKCILKLPMATSAAFC